MRYLLPILLVVSACSFDPHREGKSVVRIDGLFGSGTGFVVEAPSGGKYIVTNKHVCAGVPAFIQSSERLIFAKVLKVSDTSDLCLLAADRMEGGLQLASQEPEQHAPFYILGWGYMLGLTLTQGHWVGHPIPDDVMGVTRPSYGTATILPGNSGSPVFDQHGYVVGVAYASGDAVDNRALMVPLQDLKDFLKGL